VSPRRNPPKSTTKDNGKAINLEDEEKDIKDIHMDDEDVGMEIEEVEAHSVDPLTWLSEYVSLSKPKSKSERTSMKVSLPYKPLYYWLKSLLMVHVWHGCCY